MTPAERIVQEAMEAHGGAARWRELEALEATISARGLLFTLKHRPVLERVRVRAATQEPLFVFHDVPRPGLSSELEGDEEVRIVDAAGRVAARRARPRAAFRGLRRQLYWDDLDFAYFGGYATWNYLATPFLFLRPGFAFEALDAPPGAPAWARLRVTFPADIPTHSRSQVFWFDQGRLLRRLDYVAEVVGGWARAAHLCEQHRDFGGLKVPTRRRVRPLLMVNDPLPGPTLVAIDIHDLHPVPG